MKKSITAFTLFSALVLLLFCGFRKKQFHYDPSLVTFDTYGNTLGIIKISRRGSRMKVKYFADQDERNNSVNSRFTTWSQGKNIVAYTAGTYMTDCDYWKAAPVGVCVDNGRVINRNIRMNDLDGIVIVQATGGIVSSNLKDGNLMIYPNSGSSFKADLRNSTIQFNQFLQWSVDDVATVFQAHLLVYQNYYKIGTNGNTQSANNRRFLAACKETDGTIAYYILNNRSASGISLYEATVSACNYLNPKVNQIVFMINLDTGCQNVFSAFSPEGTRYTSPLFNPDNPIQMSNAENLLVFYYE